MSNVSTQILMEIARRKHLRYAAVEAAAASLLFLLDQEVADGGTVTVTDKSGRHRVVSLDRLFAFDAEEATK